MLKYILPALCFVALQFSANAQSKAQAALKLLDEKYPQEKIHLFFDKESYIAGETVRFKAYLFSGYVLSNISANIYVELYNDKKQLLDSTQVPLFGSIGEGYIKLKKQFPESVYYVRAYTKWMMNFNEQFNYLSELIVRNPASEKVLVNRSAPWTMRAFPESGNLLTGIENKVAVRLSSAGALPKKWSGYITEYSDTTTRLVSFQSLNPQLSSFSFTPKKGRSYLLHCVDFAGNRAVSLLRPAEHAAVIKAKQEDRMVRLEINVQQPQNNGLYYKLLAQMQGQMVYGATIRNSDEKVETKIPVDKLMSGVLHITLFNAADSPVAERLVFLDLDQHNIDLTAANLQVRTGKRELNEWPLQLPKENLSNFAIAVADPAVRIPRTRSISSDLWLGDFAPGIYMPAAYFRNHRPASVELLDALLITEKWSRFEWADLLSGTFPTLTYAPEKYLSYLGTVQHKGLPLTDTDINLVFKYSDSSTQISQVKTNEKGQFHLINNIFFDTLKIFYQPNKNKISPKDISIKTEAKNRFYPFRLPLPVSEFELRPKSSVDIHPLILREKQQQANEELYNKKYKDLANVRMDSRKKTATKKLIDSLTTGLYNTSEATTFDFVNEDQMANAYPDIYEWLVGRVPGLEISTVDGNRVPFIRTVAASVLVDEILVEDPTNINSYVSVNDIALVQVVKGYSVGLGMGGGGGGAILIYTKRPGTQTSKKTYLSPGYLLGYRSPAAELNYELALRDIIKKDVRDQLYWNSNPTGDRIRFYNNDEAASYLVTITGVTGDGIPVFIETEIK
ncbi:MAG: hypothetical protein EOO06_13660 [Chitinophagaceae bacterium]|nr:MAG: hypothetical protein EOO06_13660 [Chitinophagaceae bacterium]